ncbi:hypothetical protein WPS_19480 [Vulcanimicrobium alpinum]|uniref:Uncharacterized protein n=1 Tax=Vulcanimicrobium alpinum TaxID=3016050 RepID=A0AAN2CAI0_UNVUL|nr:hypothetical protein [Vulcanimicrobium alpinum]BDE06672.1 hypothetical protein WPS_19480 [Vulcanimicrobium alpinum]
MRTAVALLFAFLSLTMVARADRDDTREQLRTTLASAGARSDVNVTFRQSTKNPYNFVGSMTAGLKNAESLEIVISVTKSDTLGFRIYPHYNGGYVNLDRARNGPGLMRMLLRYSDDNFLFWGADDTADVFCGYTITLESGFPSDAIVVVLRSIHNTDKFLGEMRPMIDGSSPAP